jgi:SAM-dependent methyltransferase
MSFPDAAQVWDKRFSANPALFGEQPNQWLADHAVKVPTHSKVCCIADGQGRNGLFLARQGHSVDAFDASLVAIEQLRAAATTTQTQINANVLDIATWEPEPESYDVVVAIYIQFAPPALRDAIFANISRCLRSDGLLIIEGYGPRQIQHRTGGPGKLAHLYATETLSTAFEQWPVIASRDCDTTINEGSGHAGISHVVSAVLKKPGQ